MRASPAGPSLAWFARHELTLAWRDWAAMMAGGHRLRDGTIAVGALVVACGLHGLAHLVLAPVFAAGKGADAGLLAALTALLLLSFTMMLSQAMESVTRAFYARDDLDLLLSSPASSRGLFLVRIGMIALSTAAMSALLLAPFVNVAAMLGGARWLSAYGVILAVAAVATGLSVLIALGLFRLIGPKRTRLAAQVAAAVVGASFLIGLQVAAIISYGSMSRFSVLDPSALAVMVPSVESWVWVPARAVMGDGVALAVVMAAAAVMLAFSALVGAARFRQLVVRALAVPEDVVRQGPRRSAFRSISVQGVLMRKEWLLLARDPWLISQTLMQVLYLIPPALMLWVNFGHDIAVSAIIAPVVVTAIGQLAGGLAWLTISGEDAPDLVASAPVSRFAMMRAKIAAVLVIIAALVAPIALAMALLSPWGSVVTLGAALVAAASAILIQIWFAAKAKRSNFRRRQVASKTSTFCEAFVSILWAATAALAAAGSLIAVAPALLAGATLAIAWALRPRAAS